jgi:hypothetical protein
MASRGKTSMGWFFGFKLHLITDEYGNIVDFTLSTGSIHDSNKTIIDSLIEKINFLLIYIKVINI